MHHLAPEIADAYDAGRWCAINAHHKKLAPIIRQIKCSMISTIGFTNGLSSTASGDRS